MRQFGSASVHGELPSGGLVHRAVVVAAGDGHSAVARMLGRMTTVRSLPRPGALVPLPSVQGTGRGSADQRLPDLSNRTYCRPNATLHGIPASAVSRRASRVPLRPSVSPVLTAR